MRTEINGHEYITYQAIADWNVKHFGLEWTKVFK